MSRGKGSGKSRNSNLRKDPQFADFLSAAASESSLSADIKDVTALDETELKQLAERLLQTTTGLHKVPDLPVPKALDATLRHYQQYGYSWLRHHLAANRGVILADDMGLGKSNANGTKVLTPTGWVKIEDLKVGDKVIGSQGKAVNVTGVFPQGELELFEFTFSDGATIKACNEHLWAVQTPNDRVRTKKFRVMTTKELRNVKLIDKKPGRQNRQYFIPIVKPVEFEPIADLPIDPYIVGVLLGDGCVSQNDFNFVDAYQKVASEVGKKLPETWVMNGHGRKNDTLVLYKVRGGDSKQSLSESGISGKVANNKFIPRPS